MRIGLLCLSVAGVAFAEVDDLRITEVVPSTGLVEVTNLGPAFTTTDDLPFCHRFIYRDIIPRGTDFEANEAKVFTIRLTDVSDSDLWLYRPGRFNDAANIISGLKWGLMDNIGRENLASDNDKWDSSLLDTPADGMSLQLTGGDAFSGASWSIGTPSLGQYPDPAAVQLERDGNDASLTWVGGTEPFVVQQSSTLAEDSWQNISNILQERTHPVSIEGTDPVFYRVVSNAEPVSEPVAEATFRVTFTSLWGPSRFATIPPNEHFSPLVGSTHNSSADLWEAGGLASPGIKRMAETGATSTLVNEITALQNAGTADITITGGAPDVDGSFITVTFTAKRDFPLLTLVSMIAPSPDWFVGIDSLNLIDDSNDDWISSLDVDLFAYDSGTDSGTSFTASNLPSNPVQSIFMIPADDENFLPASGPVGQPIPIANFLIERINN